MDELDESGPESGPESGSESGPESGVGVGLKLFRLKVFCVLSAGLGLA